MYPCQALKLRTQDRSKQQQYKLLPLLTCCAVQITCHPLLWRAPAMQKGAPAIFTFGPARPALAFLQHHCVLGQGLLPTAAVLEMAVAAGKVSLIIWVA